jgi:hypothetical protein
MTDQRVTVFRVKYWDAKEDKYVYPKKWRQLEFIEKTDGMSILEGDAIMMHVSVRDLDDEGAYLPPE